MNRLTNYSLNSVSVGMSFCCVLAVLAGMSTSAIAQGPVRKVLTEINKVKTDYPGPITYSPSDPAVRSDRYRKQTGHFGFFYNCDGEEDKRNSPYICWNSQHNADWRNGPCNALKKDRSDIRQRLMDGSCATCNCNNCSECAAADDVYFAADVGSDELISSARSAVAKGGTKRLQPINSAILNSEAQLQAERAQLAEQLKRVEAAQRLVDTESVATGASKPALTAHKFKLFSTKKRR